MHCTVCSRIEGEDIAFNDLLHLRVKSGDDLQFVLVHSHSSPTNLHVEIALKEWFDDGLPPRAGKKRDFDEMIELNKGKDCRTHVSGTFRVKADTLPKDGFIATTVKPVSSGAASIALCGAQFKITGTPFYQLGWSFLDQEGDDNSIVDVTLKGVMKGELSDHYLVEAITFLARGFTTFVKGGKNVQE